MNFVRIIVNLFRFDRTNWKAVTLCVLTAIIFWTFNAFNKDYSANVRFPILFEFNGDKFVPAEHLPKTINVNVTGVGWDLIRKFVGLKTPQIIIPLDRPTEIKKIVVSSLLPVIASQTGNLKPNFSTDTLFLRIDKRDAHRYKLVADISATSFQAGYGRISPVVILPNTVELEGPESWLHSIIDSIVLKVNQQNISENFREEVEVEFPGSEFVKRDPPLAQIMFEVGEVKIIEKRIKTFASTKSISVVDSIPVTFQVPVARISDFNVAVKDFSVSVTDSKEKKDGKPALSILNLPSYAQVIRFDTARVKPN